MLPIPKLDESSFREIYNIMLRTAGTHLAQPQDASYQDPGNTLLELFALLFDMQRFYMDYISDEHLAVYARLLGGKPSPLCPAAVTFELFPDSSAFGRILPDGFQIDAGGISFELDGGFVISENTLEHVSVKKDSDHLNIELAFSKDLSAYPVNRLYVGFDKPIEPLPFPMDYWSGKYKDSSGEFREFENLSEHVSGGFLNLAPAEKMFDKDIFFRIYLTMRTDFEIMPMINRVLINAAKARQIKTWCSYTDVSPNADGEIILDAYLALCGQLEVYDLSGGICKKLSKKAYSIVRNMRDVHTKITVKAPFRTYRVLWYDECFTESRHIHTNGRPGQAVPLMLEHLSGDTLELMGMTNGVWLTWTRVESFNGSRGSDRHFCVHGGTILFGDNERGDIPPDRLLIIRCESSLGGAGNVREIKTACAVSIGPATGGKDRRALDIPQESIRKAVTIEDYITLLEKCPVLELDMINADAETGNSNNDSAICLYIKPVSGDPFPGLNDTYIKNIRAYLEPYRIITTKLIIKPAEYVPFSVTLDAVFDIIYKNPEAMVTEALAKQFPYPDFTGTVRRSFGERITYAEIYTCIRAVPCVNGITALIVRNAHGEQLDYLPLSPGQLAYLSDIKFERNAPENKKQGLQ